MKQIGVIGCGYWGAKHARVLHGLQCARLRSVVDSDPAKAQAIAEKYPETGWHSEIACLLADPVIDGVVIATPASTHYALARQALQAGKHVLVEKPLTLRPSEAQELTALAEAHSLTLMVGHTFEYHPAVEALRRLVRSGELGKLYYLDIARLNLGLYQRDVNVIYDLSPHDISIMHYVLEQQPVAVSARGYSMVHQGTVDVAYIEYHFVSGLVANSRVSWLSPNKVREMTLVGSQKMAVYNDIDPTAMLQVFDRGITPPHETENFSEWQFAYQYGQTRVVPLTNDEPLQREVEHFIECLTSGLPPLTDGHNGQRVVRVLHAAQESLRHGGRRQLVEEPQDERPSSALVRTTPLTVPPP